MVAAQAPAEAQALAGVSVHFADVSHAFELGGGRLDVLDRIEFAMAPGEFVALLGPSGCGKSTLLRLLAGLEEPTVGRLDVDGLIVDGPDPSRILVFQDATLFPWRTVARNVSLGLEARGRLATERHRIREALDLVGLKDFAGAFPHQLSGGMSQRAALARALVNEPRLLLMDEPLGKLDSLTRLSMQDEVMKLWQRLGFSAILVTHDVEEALVLAQRIIVLSDRPARIVDIIENDLTYPRHRDDPRLVAIRRKVLGLLGVPA